MQCSAGFNQIDDAISQAQDGREALEVEARLRASQSREKEAAPQAVGAGAPAGAPAEEPEAEQG